MGNHHNNRLFHRRVAELKQRRLSPEEEAEKLKELVARFSPTFNWTATLTDNLPLPTSPDVAATTTPAAAGGDDNNGNGHGHGHQETLSAVITPTPAPVTTPTVPTTTSTPVVNPVVDPTTVVTPNPVPESTNAIPTTSTSTVVVPAPVTTSKPPIAVTTPSTTLSITTPFGPGISSVSSKTTGTVSSSAASATETQSSGSGTNVGGIIGGLVGALIGVAALIFAVRFLLNRQRKRNDEMSAAAFNATDFRRSAMLMEDPPTHDEAGDHSFNPRPPTMIERRLASPAPTFGTQYGPVTAMVPSDYGYNQYQTYSPTQMAPTSATVMMNNSPYPDPAYPDPAYPDPAYPDPAYPDPAYPNPVYTQSPFSPVATPTSAVYNEESQQAAVLTRQPSNVAQFSANGPAGYPSEDPDYQRYLSPQQNEYVDLNRSSVTPFQATQYAEISQTLNTQVPSGLDTPALNAAIQKSNDHDTVPSPPMKAASPFSHPTDTHPGQLPYPGEVSPRPSTDSVSRQIDDFPVPPSPVHSNISRIESIPPMLPEIYVDSRPSSYTFPASNGGSGISSSVTKEYPKSPLGSQFPVAPSPLASNVDVSTSSPPAATSFSDVAPRQSRSETPAKRPDTVYDDDDAYGGI